MSFKVLLINVVIVILITNVIKVREIIGFKLDVLILKHEKTTCQWEKNEFNI